MAALARLIIDPPVEQRLREHLNDHDVELVMREQGRFLRPGEAKLLAQFLPSVQQRVEPVVWDDIEDSWKIADPALRLIAIVRYELEARQLVRDLQLASGSKSPFQIVPSDGEPDEDAKAASQLLKNLNSQLAEAKEALALVAHPTLVTAQELFAELGVKAGRRFLAVYRPDLDLIRTTVSPRSPDERDALLAVIKTTLDQPDRILGPIIGDYGNRLNLQALQFLSPAWDTQLLETYFLKGPKSANDLTAPREMRIMSLLSSIIDWNIENKTESKSSAPHPTGLSEKTRLQLCEVIKCLPNRELAAALAYHYSAEGNSPVPPSRSDLVDFLCRSRQPFSSAEEGLSLVRERIEEWGENVVSECDDPLSALDLLGAIEKFIPVSAGRIEAKIQSLLLSNEHLLSPGFTLFGLTQSPIEELHRVETEGRGALVLTMEPGDGRFARAILVPDSSGNLLPETDVAGSMVPSASRTQLKKSGEKPDISDVTGGGLIRMVTGKGRNRRNYGWLLPPCWRSEHLAAAQIARNAVIRGEKKK